VSLLSLENGLDKLSMQIQELNEARSRTLWVPATVSSSFDGELTEAQVTTITSNLSSVDHIQDDGGAPTTAPTAGGTNAFAIGDDANAAGNYSLALGDDSNVTSNYGTAVGEDASVSGVSGVALGANSTSSVDYGIAIGDSSSAGSSATAAIAIGQGAGVTSSGVRGIALGYSSSADDYSIGIGDNASAGTGSIAIGKEAVSTAADYGIAIGSDGTAGATVSGARGVAIGSSGLGTGALASAADTVAIGSGAQATAAYAIAIGGGDGGGVGYPVTQASSAESIGIGVYALPVHVAEFATSSTQHTSTSGGRVVTGYAQSSLASLSAITHDGSATEMKTGDVGNVRGGSTGFITVPSGDTIAFTIRITGYRAGGSSGTGSVGDAAVYVRSGAIKNVSGTTALVGSVNTLGTDQEDTGAAGWSVSVTADDSNDRLAISVTGATDMNVYWAGTIELTHILSATDVAE
jgi:hypothetical protein